MSDEDMDWLDELMTQESDDYENYFRSEGIMIEIRDCVPDSVKVSLRQIDDYLIELTQQVDALTKKLAALSKPQPTTPAKPDAKP